MTVENAASFTASGDDKTLGAPLDSKPADARPLWPAMVKGLRHRCPKCGNSSLFRAYLKVVDSCESCGQELHHHRADDAPPYFTIFVSGHIIIPLMIVVERFWAPAMWVHMAIWLPVTLIMCMALLPPIKGALVGLQWSFRMHGFEYDEDPSGDAGLRTSSS